MLRLGGPVFTKSEDPATLVKLHREMGFSAAFMPRIRDAAHRKEVLAAFARADIVIAEVGAYSLNILDTNEELRCKNIEAIKERLRVADDAGALCCVIHGGTVQTGGWGAGNPENFSKESFDKTVATVQAMLDDVKPRTAKLVMATATHLLPDGPEEYLELLKAVNRASFGVHFDPVNLVNSPRRYFLNSEFLRHCFALLGAHIICAHAKDVVIGQAATVHLDECPAGQGGLDYHTYLRELAGCKPTPALAAGSASKTLMMDLQTFYAKQLPPLMLEHLAGIEECRQARDYLFKVAKDAGVSFLHGELAKTGA